MWVVGVDVRETYHFAVVTKLEKRQGLLGKDAFEAIYSGLLAYSCFLIAVFDGFSKLLCSGACLDFRENFSLASTKYIYLEKLNEKTEIHITNPLFLYSCYVAFPARTALYAPRTEPPFPILSIPKLKSVSAVIPLCQTEF